MEQVVVIGAGLAGLRTVQELRSRGFDGQVVLVGSEIHPPYDRPPLSKAVLLEEPPPDSTLEVDWPQLGVDRRLGVVATGVSLGLVDPEQPGGATVGDVRSGVVQTTVGDVDFDHLVIATGSQPIRLPGDPGQRVLRTRDDALSLRSSLKEGARVVIIGAGWIGGEVATAAARNGCTVTVLEAREAPVAAVLPPEIGGLTAPWYAEHGITLRTNTAVAAVEPDGAVLASGERVPADVVLVAVGVRPAVDWLAGSGIPCDRGVLVGPTLGIDRPASGASAFAERPVGGEPSVRREPAPSSRVWAVGDVAARWSPRYGARIRGEHWDDALHAPAVLAANLLGAAETYDPVPYVWSEQFGRHLQWIGRHEGAERTVWRGDPTTDAAWTVCWLKNDRILGLLAVNRPRDVIQARRLAIQDRPVNAKLLADPGVAIRDSADA